VIVGDSRCPENAAPSPFVIDTQRLSKLNVDEDNPSAEITSFFDNSKHATETPVFYVGLT